MGARWTKREDEILQKCVEDAVFRKKTIQDGLAEASLKLNRRKLTCSSRYYMKIKNSIHKTTEAEKEITANDVFQYVTSLEQRLAEKERELEEVKKEYEVLLSIIEKARKIAFLGEEATNKPKFKMDPNGNLERIG